MYYWTPPTVVEAEDTPHELSRSTKVHEFDYVGNAVAVGRDHICKDTYQIAQCNMKCKGICSLNIVNDVVARSFA